MKKFFLLLMFLFLNGISAQKIKKADLLKIEKQVYKDALNNFDTEVAKNAIYHILALEGEQSTYLDSLAYIYFNQGNYLSGLRVANKILQKEEKEPILEIKGICLEKLNFPKKAIEVYQKLYDQNKTAALAYKLASLQEQLKRSAEAYATLKSAENLDFPKRIKIDFPSDQKNKNQKIPLKAAFYNLMAMAAYDLHNYDLAIQYFEKALSIQPDFFVAQQNKQAIELMKKKLENNNPPPPPKNNKPPKAVK